MNVVCMRCNTRYEFDDALVSSRGTSVKCTNCGHKFRVHPPAGRGEHPPDQWLIRKNAGQSVRFETLRELQKALHEGTVTVADEISRDGSTYRPIHSVPELESFFPKDANTLVGMNSPKAGLMGKATGGPRRGGGDEEDVTAVYSSEELNKLRPMRSVPPTQQRPTTSKAPAPPGPRETNSGTGPSAAPRAVVKSPIVGTGTGRSGGPPPMLARGTKPAIPAAGPMRPTSSVPPLQQRTSKVPGVTPKPAVPNPIAAPASAAPLPGTPTISVTGGAKTTMGMASDVDTVRPPPGADPGGRDAAMPRDAEEPTRVGNLSSLAKQTALGIAPPPEAAQFKPGSTSLQFKQPQPSHAPQQRSTGTLAGVPVPPMPAAPRVEVPPVAVSSTRAQAQPPMQQTLHVQQPPMQQTLHVQQPPMQQTLHVQQPSPPVAVAPSSEAAQSQHPVSFQPVPSTEQVPSSPQVPSQSALLPPSAHSAAASSGRPQTAAAFASTELAHPVNVPLPPAPVFAPPVPAPVVENEGGALPRRGRRERSEVAGPPPSAERSATASAFDALDQEPPSVAQPRSNVRWVFALLLLGGVVFGGIVLGQSYLKSDEKTAAYDTRVDSLVEAGQELYRRGDLEGARQQFEQASALSATHPAVITGQLLLLTTSCDRNWLELRLLPADAPEAGAARTGLSQCGQSLKSLEDKAATVEPSPDITAGLIDGLRLRGELASARARAASLSEHGAVPAAAYALAMLDLADEAPGWSTVLDRLRLASSGERVPGRAQVALIYALARSGDAEAATTELAKLRSVAQPHPLVPALEAFLATAAASPSASAAGTAEVPPSTASAETVPDLAAQAPGAPAVDPLEGARQARAKGDFTAAEHFYQQALQLNPGNVAALTGLGDVSRDRGNTAAALSHYHAALRASSSHLPAISSIADIHWASGDKAEAVKYYRRIGAGSVYSIRAQQRIAEFEGRPSGASPAPSAPAAPPSEPAPVPPEEKEAEPEPVPAPPEPVAEELEESPAVPGPAPKDKP